MLKNKNDQLFDVFFVFRMWVMHINADNCVESNILLLLSLLKAQGILHVLLESAGFVEGQ